jgi:hypothetical protein
VRVCSNRLWASAAVGRMSSFACAAIAPGQLAKEGAGCQLLGGAGWVLP